MDKYLIELQLPAAEKSFDVFIPKHSRIYEVRSLLCAIAGELSGGSFLSSVGTLLCDEHGHPVNINMTVKEAGICNGTRLMLI